MDYAMTGVLCVILALGFDFVNGFHDTANAVATVIAAGAMRPRAAILMAGLLNFLGAVLVGTAVAQFITKVIDINAATQPVILAVLLAGVVWNLFTWWRGLPVSSSHCLLGSLVGGGWAASGISGVHFEAVYTALIALLISPILGFVVCYAFARVIKQSSGNEQTQTNLVSDTSKQRKWTTPLLIASSGAVSFAHGSNDGQKTMGVIMLILATQFPAYGYTTSHVAFWVVLAAATAISLGTCIGGGRVIKTVTQKLSMKEITPVHGCAAQVVTAGLIFLASMIGVPVSTTHILTSAVIGGVYGLYGGAYANKNTMKEIALAWVFTLPATALISAGLFTILHWVM